MTSEASDDRALGANILAQLGYESRVPPFRKASIRVLLDALEREGNAEALPAILFALCRLYSRRAIPKLIRFAGHPAPEVRQTLAAELIHCTQEGGWGRERPDGRVNTVLLTLSRDRVGTVRNWACFSLGNSSQDFRELREALAIRLADRHADTRAEAVAGLARRNDPRAVEPLLRILETRSWRVGTWLTEDFVAFAGRSGDARFVPFLNDFRANWELGPEDLETVDDAIGRLAV